jgi:hypothetical protein
MGVQMGVQMNFEKLKIPDSLAFKRIIQLTPAHQTVKSQP